MSTDEYNGWANRETWAVALHINNDQGWQESVLEALREYVSANGYNDGDTGNAASLASGAVHREAGDIIRENVEGYLTVDGWREASGEDYLPATLSRIAEDIGSLWRVDWTEIGANFLATLADVDGAS